MSTSLDHLLPPADEALRCAEHARSIDVDPRGTAIRADRVVLVETPLPWPKPALAHPVLGELPAVLADSPVPTRLLTTVPRRAVAGTEVVVYDRIGGSARERRYRIERPGGLADLGRSLDDDAGGEATPGVRLTSEQAVAGPAVLLCTQGSHDVCCGSEGTRLAVELDRRWKHQPYELFRVSHTGGHRFAPTAMTIPDGRMWARLDAGLVESILAGAGDPATLAAQCRGWWGADQGLAQVAETAVLAETGWSLNQHDRQIEVSAPGDGGLATCQVRTPTDTWEVQLGEGRQVPTIACRQPGGQPVKSAQEYHILGLARL